MTLITIKSDALASLRTEEDIEAFLDEALDSGNATELAQAIEIVARARLRMKNTSPARLSDEAGE